MSDYITLPDIDSRSPDAKRILSSVLMWGLDRLKQFSSGSMRDIDALETSRDGVVLTLGWDDHCRNCFMGRNTETLSIPWDVFMSDRSADDWKDEQAVLAAKAKQERDEKERRRKETKAKAIAAAEETAREERDRVEYERLKTKFGTDAA